MTLDDYKYIASLTSIILEKLEQQHPNSKDVSVLVPIAKFWFAETKTYFSCTKPHHRKTLDWYCILKVND